MLLLGKIFNFRSQTHSEEEKPFLDHLDDLRITLIQLLVTLVIGICVCFTFRNNLMEIMRAPIDGVWKLQLQSALHELPVKITPAVWEKATKVAKESEYLTTAQKEHFITTSAEGSPEFAFHVESVILWRSALAIEENKKRTQYIEGIPEISQGLRQQLLSMQVYYQQSKGAGPNPDAEFRRRTIFMQLS